AQMAAEETDAVHEGHLLGVVGSGHEHGLRGGPLGAHDLLRVLNSLGDRLDGERSRSGVGVVSGDPRGIRTEAAAPSSAWLLQLLSFPSPQFSTFPVKSSGSLSLQSPAQVDCLSLSLSVQTSFPVSFPPAPSPPPVSPFDPSLSEPSTPAPASAWSGPIR